MAIFTAIIVGVIEIGLFYVFLGHKTEDQNQNKKEREVIK